MCGIAGVWNLKSENIDRNNFIDFTNSLNHRGPDNLGTYFNGNNFALGHRRLSIIDLSENANQPLRYKDSEYLICYNGEIYNFLEIKKELKQLGYQFNTNSDTEVVLVAYIQWGVNCLRKFNGMWSFAIWNELKQELFLSRDRYGIKPLFYTFKNNKFIFASETIAFKKSKEFKRTIDDDNLIRAINDPNTLEAHGHTIFKDIFQLLPGHFIKINSQTKNVFQKRWWNSLNQQIQIPNTYNEQVEEFRSLFENSCLVRLKSDVKIGTALSGGLDSSSVYCMLHELQRKGNISKDLINNQSWKNAFVATFPESKINEENYAKKVIEYTNGSANFLQISHKNIIDDIIKSTKLFDSITATPIMIVSSIYRAMKELDLKVSLDGHGVDEMMFGYQTNVQEAYFCSLINNDLKYADDILDIYGNMFFSNEIKNKKNSLFLKSKKIIEFERKIEGENLLKKYLKKMYHFFDDKSCLPAYYSDNYFGNKKIRKLKHLSDSPYKFNKFSDYDRSLAISFNHTDLPYNLRDFDRASMQESVEIRMPFLDWRLVNYTFSLPVKSRLGNGYTKLILRDAMNGLMPDEIKNRKLKIGLTAPLDKWINKELKSFVIDEINSRSFLQSSIWDGKLLNKLFHNNYNEESFTPSDLSFIWKILNAHLIVNS